MGASVCTVNANVPAFMPTKASQPTFWFDKNDIYSNNKTVDKGDAGANCNTTYDNDNNKIDYDRFYGMAI